jgi:hypothetical protein
MLDLQAIRQRAAARASAATPASAANPANRASNDDAPVSHLATLAMQCDLRAELVDAIDRCCNVRGDDETNRAALIADALELTPELQADLLAHFLIEIARLSP